MIYLNFFFGLWAVYVSLVAVQSVHAFSFQTILILLFVFSDALQGILLVLAPRPKVKLVQISNIIPVVFVIILTMIAGVNVVRSPLPNGVGIALLFMGQILALWATLHLGRRFGIFAEARGYCTTGPYRFFRHPMYIGYGCQYLGLMLQSTSLWAWTCLLLAGFMQVWRARQENAAIQQFLIEKSKTKKEILQDNPLNRKEQQISQNGSKRFTKMGVWGHPTK
jgi:protein-S-isoprenylcysteine O-methyltransferase Ste14